MIHLRVLLLPPMQVRRMFLQERKKNHRRGNPSIDLNYIFSSQNSSFCRNFSFCLVFFGSCEQSDFFRGNPTVGRLLLPPGINHEEEESFLLGRSFSHDQDRSCVVGTFSLPKARPVSQPDRPQRQEEGKSAGRASIKHFRCQFHNGEKKGEVWSIVSRRKKEKSAGSFRGASAYFPYVRNSKREKGFN